MARRQRRPVYSWMLAVIIMVAGMPGARAQLSKTVGGVHDMSASSLASRANTAKAQERMKKTANEDASANQGVKCASVLRTHPALG